MQKFLLLVGILLMGSTALPAQSIFSTAASRVRRGNGAPASGECAGQSDVGRVWVRQDGTAGQNLSVCEWNGGSPRWAAAGGGGTSSSGVACPNSTTGGAFSQNYSTDLSGGPCSDKVLIPSSAVTSVTISGGSASATSFLLVVRQGGTGFAVSGLAGNLHNVCPISVLPNIETWIRFSYDPITDIYDGSDCYSRDPTVPEYGAGILTGSTYAVALSTPLAALTAGVRIVMTPDTNNSGAFNLNVTGLGGSAFGAVAAKACDGSTPAASAVHAGYPTTFVHNGTNFIIQGCPNSSTTVSRLWYPAAGCNGSSGTLCNPSGAFDVTGGSGAANSVSTAAGKFPYLAFDASYTATLSHILTAAITTVTVNLWVYQSDGGASGNWEIDFSAACVANGGSMAPTMGTMVPVTNALPANLVLARWQAVLTPSGTCSQGNHLLINAAHVADSGSGNGTKLYGIQVVEQ